MVLVPSVEPYELSTLCFLVSAVSERARLRFARKFVGATAAMAHLAFAAAPILPASSRALAYQSHHRSGAVSRSIFPSFRCEAGSGDTEKDVLIAAAPERLDLPLVVSRKETRLMSVLPLLPLAALPGAATVTALFEPYGDLVRAWDLPSWLVHWGHPGNMAVVLFAMGGYGSYLGWQIRLSPDGAARAAAKDLHPKLLAGMFFFFAAGAVGGITSLVTTGDKPIFESPHAVTGLIGLALLGVQSGLSSAFKANPNLRTVHAFLGTIIMAFFLLHAIFGLQLGLQLDYLS